MSEIITIASRKGGVGKTSTTLMLASILAGDNKRVLVVDLDSQHNASSRLVDSAASKPVWRMFDLLEDESRHIGKAISVAKKDFKNVFFIEADARLAKAHQILADKISRESVLKEILAPIRDKFDFILLDTPPAADNVTVNALSASTSFLIPCDMSIDALDGAKVIISLVEQLKKKNHCSARFLGVLLCMFEKESSNLAIRIQEIIDREFSDKVIKTRIPATVKISESASAGLTPYQLFRSHRVTKAYEQVVKTFT